jgi:hypothetical protein
MQHALSFLTGAGLGAGLMCLLDPQEGRRRRALARDKIVHAAHEVRDTAGVVAKDVKNRARGLAAGDLSVLAGGRRALHNPLRGSWSPSARALMGLAGAGLFLYGLTQKAPLACFLGTAGVALTIEGAANLGIEDMKRVPEAVSGMAEKVGIGDRRHSPAQPVGV